MSKTTNRPDIYTRITNAIIAELETGTRPWMKPWNAKHAASRITRPLRHNGTPYQGINTIMLWSQAAAQGYGAPVWMTYKQASALGGQVRKDEKGTLVVYANTLERTETDKKTGEEVEQRIPFLKGYSVFNADQIDDLPDEYTAIAEPPLDPVERIDRVERFFRATGADIQHRCNMACYNMTADTVRMPPFETFRDAESYYATLAHEMTHWTRHPSRLDRDFGRKRFADEGYARDELVAALGSAFLAADLEIALEPRSDHASYIESWLEVLKNDKRAIVQAASYSQKAVDYLHGLQPGTEEAP